MNVRSSLPKRRDIPTKNPTGTNWREHKPDLKEDFHEHCAYCGSYDGFRHTYFEVDHFVPKVLFSKTNKIGLCQYDNLVYSCKFCNNIKLNKWPSNNEAIPNINNEGFIDPCDINYEAHLYRTDDGSIRWHTELGKWMVEQGFKFDERDYAIKLLWELDQLRVSIEILSSEIKKYDKKSEEYITIKEKLYEYNSNYFLFHNDLIKYYNTI